MGVSMKYLREGEGCEHIRETWEWSRGLGITLSSKPRLGDFLCTSTSQDSSKGVLFRSYTSSKT